MLKTARFTAAFIALLIVSFHLFYGYASGRGKSEKSQGRQEDFDFSDIDISEVESDLELADKLPAYRILITGLIRNEREVTFESIIREYGDQAESRVVSGSRTDGERIEQSYTGIDLRLLLDPDAVQDQARNLVIYGSDGYSAPVPIEALRKGSLYLVWKRSGEYLVPSKDGVLRVVHDGGMTSGWVKNPMLFEVVSEFTDLVPLADRKEAGRIDFTTQQDMFVLNIGAVPEINADQWRLKVGGKVDRELTLDYDDILGMPQETVFATLETISNPPGGSLIGNAVFTGVPLTHVLERAGVGSAAQEVVFYCEDGYSTSITMQEASDTGVLLAYKMNARTLLPEHGYPVRLVVPEKFGMKWPKWITDIQLVDYDYRGYWEQRGWSDYAGRDRPEERYD
jgi:DMSO/TMAO reductase YedYZ molybdopterin-dependent catalytic subunit